jgi:transcriptional regulator with XRE-family HTH domain
MAPVRRSPPSLNDLGQVLRDFRRAKEMTQEQLSFRSGMTTALISDSENGKRNLSFESLGKLLAALDATWDEFGAALARQQKRRG